MVNIVIVNETTEQRKPNTIQSANRSIFLIVLLATTLFGIFTAIGASEAAAICLSTTITLVALQLLLKGTANSPSEVLKHYRGVRLLTATGVAFLLFIMTEGLLTFAATFTPNLYAIIELAQFKANSIGELSLLILGVAVLAPFYEELVFRGLALKAYRDARSTIFAVLFTSAVFGLIHGSMIQALALFPIGIVFALVMLKTQQLWTVIAAHALYNFIGVTVMQLEIEALPTTPTFGILGLITATAAFWVAVRWIGLPKDVSKSAKSESIWTVSLVTALIIAALSIGATTYVALGPGVEAVL